MSDPVPTPATTEDVAAARSYMLALGAAALLVLALVTSRSLGELGTAGRPAVLLLMALGATSVVFPLRFHHGDSVQGFNLVPSVLLTLAMLSADGVALLTAVGMVGIGYAIATRSVVKTAFNVTQFTLASGLGLAAGRLAAGGPLGGDVLAARSLAGLLVAAAVAGVASAVLVSELIHQMGGTDRRRLLREVLGPAAWVMASDFVIAVLLTILADRSPAAVVLAVPMFVGLLLGYRGFAADREAARQAELLHDTSRQLLEGALHEGALDEAVDGLRDLFAADRATLVADADGGPPWAVTFVGEVMRTGAPLLRTRDPVVMAAPVRLDGKVVGTLVVAGRRGLDDWGPTDLDLLSTVAGEIAATLRTRRLLDQIERERARLAAETSKLTDVLASASDGIVVLDDEGRVDACNPAMTRLLGVQWTTLGLPWQDVLALEDEQGRPVSEEEAHPLTVALQRRQRIEGATVVLRRPDGERRWLRCSAAPVRSEGVDRDAAGIVLVAVDLTREREIDQLRSDFIATVSHELRTPLTPLGGFLKVLREHGASLDEDRRHMMVGAMQKQVDRLSDLIGDLLHVAEIDSGATIVHRTPVALAQAVSDVVDIEAVGADERSRLTVEVDDAVVVGDPAAVRRVLRALLSNAFKHTSGPVTVVVGLDGGHGVVRVRDDGPLVPSAFRDTVFEPFRRLGDHLHRTQGPGLGLAIGRSLAEAMDGSLDLEVASGGQGNEFVLRLPTVAATAADRAAGVAGGTVGGPPERG